MTHRRRPQPGVLFLADVAARLRCSPDTIRRRLRDGTFPVAPIPSIDHRVNAGRKLLICGA